MAGPCPEAVYALFAELRKGEIWIPSGQVLFNAAVNGLLLGGIFAIAALGLSMMLGVMRIINLWHGELLMLSAYLGWLLFTRTGIDPLLGILLVAPLMFLLGYVIQRTLLTPLMRSGAEGPLLTTFGLSVIAQNLFILIFSADTRTISPAYASDTMSLFGMDVPLIYVVGFAIALLVFAAAHVILERTSLGRDIRASTEDATAAEMNGVDVRRVYALTYGLGAACAAVGGVLAGMAFPFTPTSGIGYLLNGFSVVVLGGLGSVTGTLLGGLAIGFAESVGGAIFGDGYQTLVGLIVFLVFLAVRPQGLLGRAMGSMTWRT